MYEATEFQERIRKRGEYKTTTNSSLFRKLHKLQHAHCSYCTWHPRKFGQFNENSDWRFYCVDMTSEGRTQTRLPNWKLCSRNRKQWQQKRRMRYYCNLVIQRDTNSSVAANAILLELVIVVGKWSQESSC